MSRALRPTALCALLILGTVACGGDTATTSTTSAPTSTEASPTTTTSAPPPTTTTTAPPSTTTTEPATTTTIPTLEGDAIHSIFSSYLDAIVAKQWDQARSLATGSAADYATFTEHLDAISPQPVWQLDSATEPDCCEVVEIGADQFATATAISYNEPNGASLAVSNPVVSTNEGDLLLVDWGVDVGTGDTGPALSQRLRDISVFPFDPSVCTSGSNWAYVPGGTETSETVRIIMIGAVCDSTGEVTPDQSRTTIFTTDGSLDLQATTVLWEGGPDPIPTGEVRLFLAIFDIPAEAATQELFAGAGFQPSSGQSYTFTIEIGAFDLG